MKKILSVVVRAECSLQRNEFNIMQDIKRQFFIFPLIKMESHYMKCYDNTLAKKSRRE